VELFARAGFHERAFQALHGLETDIAQDELHHADVLAAQVRLLLDAGDRDAAVVAF
jgi:Mn-containing catalase